MFELNSIFNLRNIVAAAMLIHCTTGAMAVLDDEGEGVNGMPQHPVHVNGQQNPHPHHPPQQP